MRFGFWSILLGPDRFLDDDDDNDESTNIDEREQRKGFERQTDRQHTNISNQVRA